MPRPVQALAFFALLGGWVLVVPSPGGAERLAVLLSGSMVAVAVAYVLPWVFFGLDTDPVSVPDE